jgi:transposase-like protein
MECKCPSCSSGLVKKNGHVHNGKQNYRCLKCSKQFVLEPSQKLIDEKTRNFKKDYAITTCTCEHYMFRTTEIRVFICE